MKRAFRTTSLKKALALSGVIFALALPATGFAAEDVPVIENSENTTTNVVITFPGQPNTGGDYTNGNGNGTTSPGNPGLPNVGGVKDPTNPSTPVVTNPQFYLDSEEYSVTVGDTLDTSAFFKINQGSAPTRVNSDQVIYYSEHPEILQVDNQGNLTGLKPGLARVTAWYSGLKFTASVLVVNPYAAH